MVDAPPDQEGRSPTAYNGPHKTGALRRRWFLFALLVLILASGMLGWPWISRQRDRRQWLQLAQQGRYAEVESHLKTLLEGAPRDVPVLRALAIGQMNNGNMAAEPYLDQWCALSPGDAEAFKRRMELRRRLGRDPEALADGLHVLQADPEDLEVRREVCKL